MRAFACLLLFVSPLAIAQDSHDELVQLFSEWRAFESPPELNGAPDYTVERFEGRDRTYQALRNRLDAIDTSEWSIDEKVDWNLVRAEMNGYDFNRRILKPWERDPAFYDTIWTYRSDVPAHEGPTHHAVVEIWQYEFPLTPEADARLADEL